MNTYFNPIVDEAVEVLYYSYDIVRGQEVFKKLQKAAQEGDADAMYLLARCYAGDCYCWEGFGFPEDDAQVEKYMRMSILGGSAMGVIGAMRTGMLSKELERKMPFSNLKEAWDIIYKEAKVGSGFCQNMIGNTYYWLDIIRIEGRDVNQFLDLEEWRDYLRQMMLESIPWYEEALRNKVSIAGRNMVNLYEEGDEDLQIVPQPEKAIEVIKLGAELGLMEWMYYYGRHLTRTQGREEEGVHWYKRAAETGMKSAWYEVAYAYEEGIGVAKNLKKALEYAEKGLGTKNDVRCSRIIGAISFEGAEGVPKNYEYAVHMLEHARAQGDPYDNDYLAVCYAMGYGCQKDLQKAKQLLEEIDYRSNYTKFVWGLLHIEGVGVKKSIKEAISYWKSVEGECLLVEKALVQYKKTLYGKWVSS